MGVFVQPEVPHRIPNAGELRGFGTQHSVIFTGPAGIPLHLTHSEARALASWLMKMSAEEPT
jgi:hypothetical protein